jgi:LuxR family maltose regulon positive regulatory protein
MSAWTRAAIGVRRTSRNRVGALLAQPDPTRLPSTAVDAALFETAEALRDGNRAAARRDLDVALRRAEELDAVRPFAVAEPDVRSFLADQVRVLANRSAFACRAVLSDPRLRLPHSTRLSGRQRDVLDQLSSMRNLDEIADHLAVPVIVVKSDVRAIYGRLGVSSRRTAVLAAHEQGLLR